MAVTFEDLVGDMIDQRMRSTDMESLIQEAMDWSDFSDTVVETVQENWEMDNLDGWDQLESDVHAATEAIECFRSKNASLKSEVEILRNELEELKQIIAPSPEAEEGEKTTLLDKIKKFFKWEEQECLS